MKTIEVIKNKAILISSETARELEDYLRKKNKSKTKQPNKLLKMTIV